MESMKIVLFSKVLSSDLLNDGRDTLTHHEKGILEMIRGNLRIHQQSACQEMIKLLNEKINRAPKQFFDDEVFLQYFQLFLRKEQNQKNIITLPSRELYLGRLKTLVGECERDLKLWLVQSENGNLNKKEEEDVYHFVNLLEGILWLISIYETVVNFVGKDVSIVLSPLASAQQVKNDGFRAIVKADAAQYIEHRRKLFSKLELDGIKTGN
jgi:hypothetical protein